jgi:hypothetical protein
MIEEVRERIGSLIGKTWAPAIAAIAKARQARMFHPVGLTFEGTAAPMGEDGELGSIGEALAGRVLARCSAALWKKPLEHFDVLGIALRFMPDDQDLLFATIISPLTMPLSPLTTNAHDFMANRYWAVAPFALRSGRRVKLRLVPIERRRDGEGPRNTRLRHDVKNNEAALMLQARRTLHRTWESVALIRFDRERHLDQNALRFDPFKAGRGIEPVGLVHAIRRAAYAASQRARSDGHN